MPTAPKRTARLFFRKKLEEMNRNIEEIGRNEQKYRYEEMDDDVGGDGAADGM
jgi:hypothetical protein